MKKRGIIYIILAFLLLLTSCGERESEISAPVEPLELISETQTFGQTYNVNVVNDKAYIAAGTYVIVYDVTNKTAPVELSSQKVDLNCYDLQMVECDSATFGAERLLYAGNGNFGVHAFDATTVEDTIIDLGIDGGPNGIPYVHDVEILKINEEKHYVISSNSTSGIRIMRLNYNPPDPPWPPSWSYEVDAHFLSSELGGRARHVVAVDSNTLYAACGVGNFKKIDISDPDPANWQVVDGVDTYGDMRGLFIQGKYAYAADGGFGFDIIDLETMELVSNINTAGFARDVYVVGDKAYLADGSRGLRVIDISDKENPEIIATFDIEHGYANAVFAEEDYIYVADKYRGLLIIGWK